jgi:lysophospholipase L1-like esterase
MACVVASLCALVALTCASVQQAPPVAASSDHLAPARVSVNPAGASSAAATPPRQPEAKPRVELPLFYRSLGQLAAGTRTDPVRVAWLGDSHTLADFWTGTVRQRLTERFGAGGPGFLQAATQSYGRAGARVEVSGTFRREPKSPSKIVVQLDGVFGVAGTRVVAEPAARLTIEAGASASKPPLHVDVFFRLPSPADDFQLVTGSSTASARAATAATIGDKGVRAWSRAIEDGSKVELRVTNGHPELFGIAVESQRPGVVIDNYGINGARVGTTLAWDESTFTAMLRSRAPTLVVLAYGTNDVVSELGAERLAEQYRVLVSRLRAAGANECLLLGPPDLFRDGATHPRVTLIDATERAIAAELGCAYWSAFEAMGSAGGFARWLQEAPPLAAADGVHLTAAGYERLGSLLSDDLLASYEQSKPLIR